MRQGSASVPVPVIGGTAAEASAIRPRRESSNRRDRADVIVQQRAPMSAHRRQRVRQECAEVDGRDRGRAGWRGQAEQHAERGAGRAELTDQIVDHVGQHRAQRLHHRVRRREIERVVVVGADGDAIGRQHRDRLARAVERDANAHRIDLRVAGQDARSGAVHAAGMGERLSFGSAVDAPLPRSMRARSKAATARIEPLTISARDMGRDDAAPAVPVSLRTPSATRAGPRLKATPSAATTAPPPTNTASSLSQAVRAAPWPMTSSNQSARARGPNRRNRRRAAAG